MSATSDTFRDVATMPTTVPTTSTVPLKRTSSKRSTSISPRTKNLALKTRADAGMSRLGQSLKRIHLDDSVMCFCGLKVCKTCNWTKQARDSAAEGTRKLSALHRELSRQPKPTQDLRNLPYENKEQRKLIEKKREQEEFESFVVPVKLSAPILFKNTAFRADRMDWSLDDEEEELDDEKLFAKPSTIFRFDDEDLDEDEEMTLCEEETEAPEPVELTGFTLPTVPRFLAKEMDTVRKSRRSVHSVPRCQAPDPLEMLSGRSLESSGGKRNLFAFKGETTMPLLRRLSVGNSSPAISISTMHSFRPRSNTSGSKVPSPKKAEKPSPTLVRSPASAFSLPDFPL